MLLLGWIVRAVQADPAGQSNPGQDDRKTIQRGIACWHDGTNLTTSGEAWAAEGFMAAHRTLPLGTWVRVINLKNGLATVVRVTDRGPHTRTRLIDISPAAARQIGLLDAGIAKVTVEVVPAPTAPIKPTT